ncbi:hypothetical protein RIF29_12244 [Crotalaria pallida]|uniref:Uncharacterized protein n=1 Tax=Crotalaria pallida TaxID=3830 RepID=A0AAN9IMZ6_CROPI
MDKSKSSQAIRKLRRAVKKLKSLLHCWRVHSSVSSESSKKSLSTLFNNQMGLQNFVEDEEINKDHTMKYIETPSYAAEDDIDKRAEIFIANFRRHLWLERQASLERKRRL